MLLKRLREMREDLKKKREKQKGKTKLKYPKLSKSINKIMKKDSYVQPKSIEEIQK